MKILNLTLRQLSSEQLAIGVVESKEREKVKELLTFEEIPNKYELEMRATALAEIAARERADAALIGDVPFLIPPLEKILKTIGIKPLYDFSRLETVERVSEDGSIIKQNIFRHLGFVEV